MNNDLENFLEKLEVKVKDMFVSETSGHDIYHLDRVRNLALHIQEKEGGDQLIIGVSAFLHDIHRLMEKDSGMFVHPKESLPIIKNMLEEISFPENEISKVLHCVEYHEEYEFSKEGKTVTDIETLVLQDADNLDAIGAIGIARTFTFGGAHSVPMWIPEKPFDREFFNESEKDPSTLHHFYSKLLKLKGNMNTKTGKEMAEERHAFMENYINQFLHEWNGEK